MLSYYDMFNYANGAQTYQLSKPGPDKIILDNTTIYPYILVRASPENRVFVLFFYYSKILIGTFRNLSLGQVSMI